MCNDFRIIYRGSVRTLIPTTCWQVKRSICLKNSEWPPDLCTSARAKQAPTLFGGLRKSTWQRLSSYLEISLKVELSRRSFLGTFEHEVLRSKGRYTRQYLYVIGLIKICIITAHAHAVDTRPSLSVLSPPPLEGLGTRLVQCMHITRENFIIMIKLVILFSSLVKDST